MRERRIVFRFEGRMADRGLLDASDLVTYDAGVRRLLALHAHFFTTGSVPRGPIANRGPGYRVFSKDPRAACYEGHWVVQLGEVVVDELAKGAAGYAIRKAGKYVYENLLRDSLEPILGRARSSMPPELRIEPVLPGLDKINAPVFDAEAERDHLWGRLRDRATILMPEAFRPVGRSADTLVIMGENLRISRIDAATMRKLLEDARRSEQRRQALETQITEALSSMGRLSPHGRPLA